MYEFTMQKGFASPCSDCQEGAIAGQSLLSSRIVAATIDPNMMASQSRASRLMIFI